MVVEEMVSVEVTPSHVSPGEVAAMVEAKQVAAGQLELVERSDKKIEKQSEPCESCSA